MDAFRSLARRLAVLAAFSSATTAGDPLVLHVDDDAPPGGDGASWPTALADLQDALEIARVHVGEARIKIAQGVYTPDRGSGDRAAAFVLTGLAPGSTPPPSDHPGMIEYEPETVVTCSAVRLTLEGGFAGLKMFKAPDTHDPVFYPTVLSGDLAGDDDQPGGSRDDNAYTVVEALPRSCDTILLQHLTITGGHAYGDAPDQFRAGGLFVGGFSGQAVQIESCVFRDNAAFSNGGGIYGSGVDLNITNCVFVENQAANDGGGLFWSGGPDSGSELQIRGCVFDSNDAFGQGGGVSANDGSVWIESSTFRDNFAFAPGGAIHLKQTNQAHVIGSRIHGNSSRSHGSGIRADAASSLMISATWFTNNNSILYENVGALSLHYPDATIESCVFAGNFGLAAHAIGITQDGNSCRVVNCTFADNGARPALHGAPIILIANSSAPVEIRNSILWRNTLRRGAPAILATEDVSGVVVVDHTLVQGGLDAFAFEGGPFSPFFFGDLVADADPRFLDPDGPDKNPDTIEDNDYTPGRNSPAIDHARTGLLSLFPYPDAAGNRRTLDLPSYAGHEALHTDIGAFESRDTLTPFCVDDFDTNPAPEYADILAFLVAFGAQGIEADLHRDAMFDIHDVLEFLDAFARGCE